MSASHRPSTIVVGAGSFGLWTGLSLQKLGHQVTLIDAWGPGNARSSSGGTSRVIRGMYGGDAVYTEWVRSAFDAWKALERDSGIPIYQQTGSLWMFDHDDDYVQQSIPVLRRAGLPVDQLTTREAEQRFPQVAFGGIESVYFEQEAGYLAARTACRALSQQILHLGGTMLIGQARPNCYEAGRLQSVSLPDGSALHADHFVFACGPWLGQVFPDVIGDSLQPTRQEVFFFGTPAGSRQFHAPELPVWIEMSDRVIYGIPGNATHDFKLADDTRGGPFDPTAGDRVLSEEGIARARQYLAKRFPGLRDAPLLESRVCVYENSPDGDLIIDQHPKADNLWIVGGGSGHGFKLSPSVGRCVADRISGKTEHLPKFGLQRFTQQLGRKTQFGK